jgi:hypothetical protein
MIKRRMFSGHGIRYSAAATAANDNNDDIGGTALLTPSSTATLRETTTTTTVMTTMTTTTTTTIALPATIELKGGAVLVPHLARRGMELVLSSSPSCPVPSANTLTHAP